MTRKDYINIAGAILATQTRIGSEAIQRIADRKREYGDRFLSSQEAAIREHERSQLRGVRRTAAHLADFLKEDNPQGFDPVLFLRNCGY